MITLAARAVKPKSKVAKAKSKVSSKSVTKVAAGRKGGNTTAAKTTKTAKKTAPKESYYVRNRAKLLARQKKYYRAHKTAIKMRVNKWRHKCTKKVGGVKTIVPYYAQGKKNGKRPINPRLPRLNGPTADRGRDLTTGKKPVTNITGRRAVEKKEAKYDRAKEAARKGPGRPKKVGRPAKAKSGPKKATRKLMR